MEKNEKIHQLKISIANLELLISVSYDKLNELKSELLSYNGDYEEFNDCIKKELERMKDGNIL